MVSEKKQNIQDRFIFRIGKRQSESGNGRSVAGQRGSGSGEKEGGGEGVNGERVWEREKRGEMQWS